MRVCVLGECDAQCLVRIFDVCKLYKGQPGEIHPFDRSYRVSMIVPDSAREYLPDTLAFSRLDAR